MNKYCNLDGYKKIKDDFQNINIGFDRVEEDVDKINTDVKNIDDRVDTIITTPVEGVSAQEIVDARKGKPTLGDKIQSIDDSLSTHINEKVTDGDKPHGIGTVASQDYETGSWTPVLYGSKVEGEHEYTDQIGRYVKIGNKVTVWFNVYIKSFDDTMDGNVEISGLPFTSRTGIYTTFPLASYRNVKFPENYNHLNGRVPSRGSVIHLAQDGVNIENRVLLSSDIRQYTWLRGQFEYEIE